MIIGFFEKEIRCLRESLRPGRSGISDLLNEVRYKSRSYIVERNGKPIARLVPVSDLKEAKKLKELKNLLSSLPSCSDDLQAFAKDLEKIARQQHPYTMVSSPH